MCTLIFVKEMETLTLPGSSSNLPLVLIHLGLKYTEAVSSRAVLG